jgi:uncharacterized protein YndB with AHSA1/START domain
MRIVRAVLFTGLATLLVVSAATAQKVRDTSFVAGNERVLQQEIVVDADIHEVWNALSTSERLKTFIAPVASLELKRGGKWLANFNPKARLEDDPSTLHNEVISYVPLRMLSTKIGMPKGSPVAVREADSLFEVIQLEPAGERKVRVIDSVMGWKTGKEWDGVYSVLVECDQQTLEAMYERFKSGPLNWSGTTPYSSHSHEHLEGHSASGMKMSADQ